MKFFERTRGGQMMPWIGAHWEYTNSYYRRLGLYISFTRLAFRFQILLRNPGEKAFIPK